MLSHSAWHKHKHILDNLYNVYEFVDVDVDVDVDFHVLSTNDPEFAHTHTLTHVRRQARDLIECRLAIK